MQGRDTAIAGSRKKGENCLRIKPPFNWQCFAGPQYCQRELLDYARIDRVEKLVSRDLEALL
jgi:hypothetical protein